MWLAALILVLVCAVPANAAAAPTFRDVRAAAERAPAQPITALAAKAQARLRASMGPQGLVDVDPITGTPRVVAKLNGFLTSTSDASARAIAIAYLRRHAAAFGLDDGDISSLRLTRSYTDVRGTTHLIWAQTFDGIQALDNGVHANVAENGRLVNVSDSPVADLGVRTVQPDVSARQAMSVALRNAGTPAGSAAAARPDDARLVLFTVRPGVTRLAWRVTADVSPTEVYDYVVDAATGKVLYRENAVDSVRNFGYVWESAPNINAICSTCAPEAGAQDLHDFGFDWNRQSDHPLSGTFASVYTDIDDDGQPDSPSPDCRKCGYTEPNTMFGRNDSPTWYFPFFPNPGGLVANGGEEGSDCSATFPQCSWYRHDPGYLGWRRNIEQNSTQVYWYVNTFHDWLKTDAIGFNAASGAFEGRDRVEVQTFNGADTGVIPGTPDSKHVNTTSMFTPRDGFPPTMQLSLFDNPGARDVQTNPGDDASIVDHEYAHGLSSRLVTDPAGTSALRSFQARAMGEGWSDWYALDFLEGNDLERDDTAAGGQMNLGTYTTGGDIHSLRTQGLDCQVGARTPFCPGGFATGRGGYTLGDMGRVADGPEIHADGEIWGETLWDLRHNWVGSSGLTPAAAEDQIRTIVTDGMRVSPPDPSMLDERNAILQATTIAFPSDRALYRFVWRTFAHRGMGYFASDLGSSDTHPRQDFSTPPSCRAAASCGRLTGVVVAAGSGNPVPNATVAIRGFGDLVATTNRSGHYTIGRVPPHTYELVSASHGGFKMARRTNVTVGTGTSTLDFRLRRDRSATVAPQRASQPPVITGAEILDGQTIRLISARGLKVSAHLSEPGNIRGALVISPAKAEELGIPRRIGTGKVRFAAPSTQTLTMNLTQEATSAIKREPSLRVTATLNPTSSTFRRGKPVWRVATLPH